MSAAPMPAWGPTSTGALEILPTMGRRFKTAGSATGWPVSGFTPGGIESGPIAAGFSTIVEGLCVIIGFMVISGAVVGLREKASEMQLVAEATNNRSTIR